MSTTIDQKVLEMRFDNRNFESGVSTTISSLNKLDQAMVKTGSTTAFDGMNSSAKKVDLSPISKSVDSISVKFSAMQVAFATATARITNAAIDAGKNITKALTITPVMTGYQEYETQINAVQTILANTTKEGATIGKVNAALDELNTYADKTIYNFTEMTRNIGTFTAAGVNLDTSVEAIKGIANLAAVSGSNAHQASTAMYQLSQALSAGRITLMDWNSVVNAGMGGQVFQDSLIETARVMGVQIDKIIEDAGSFRNSLTEEWLSADVLTETLAKFTGDLSAADLAMKGYTEEQIKSIMEFGVTANDAATKVKTFTQLMDTMKEAIQSGWSQTMRLLIGDFEEAKELFTEVSNVLGEIIGHSSDSRFDVLMEGLGSGWEKYMAAGIINEEEYIDFIKTVAESRGIAIDEMIAQDGSFIKTLGSGWLTSDIMAESLGVYTTKMLSLTDAQIEQLGYTEEQLRTLAELNYAVQNGSISLEQFANEMTQLSGRENLIQAMRNSFEAIGKVIGPITVAFDKVFGVTGEEVYSFTEAIERFTRALIISDETAIKIGKTFQGVFSAFNIAGVGLSTVFGSLWTVLTAVLGVANIDFLDFTAGLGDWITAIKEWLTMNDILINKSTLIYDSVQYVIKGLINWKNAMLSIPQVQNAVILTQDAFYKIMAKLGPFVSSVSDSIYSFITSLSSMEKISFSNIKELLDVLKSDIWENMKSMTSVFSNFFSSISILYSSIYEKTTGIGKALLDMGERIYETFKTVFGFLSENFGAITVMILAAGLFILIHSIINVIQVLTGVMAIFSRAVMGVGDAIQSIGKILLQFSGVVNAKKWELRASALKSFAIALALIAGSLVLMTQVDQGKLWSAVGVLVAMTLVLLGLSFAMTKMASTPNSIKTSGIIIALSAGLLIMSSALEKLNEMDPWSVLRNLMLMTLMGGVLVAVAHALSKTTSKVTTGVVMLISVAGSLYILASVFSKLSEISFDQITSSILPFIAIMGMIGVLLIASRLAGQHATKAGIMILSISVAMNLLVLAIKSFANLEKNMLTKAVSNMAGIGIIFAGLIAVSYLAGKNATKAGLLLLSMAGSMLILTGVVFLLGSMKNETLQKGIFAVEQIGFMMTLMVAASGLAKKAAATILSFTLAISALMFSIALMTILDQEKVITAALVMSGVMLTFGLIVAMTKYANGTKQAMSVIITMSVITVMLAGLLFIISELPTEKAIGSALSLGILLMSFSSSIYILSKANTVSKTARTAALQMVLVTAALSGVLYFLAEQDFESLIASAAAMSIVMTSLTTSVAILSKARTVSKTARTAAITLSLLTIPLGTVLYFLSEHDEEALLSSATSLSAVLLALTSSVKILDASNNIATSALLAAGTLTLITAGLGAVLYFLNTSNISGSLESAASLSLLLISIAGAAYILSYIGGPLNRGITSGLAAFAKLAAVVVGVVALAAIIAESVDDYEGALEGADKFLTGLGSAVGGFFGGIIGGFASGATADLDEVGTSISNFMTNAGTFFETVENIDQETLDKIPSLATAIGEVMKIMPSSTTTPSAGIDYGTYFENMGTQLEGFGGAYVKFAESISSVSNETLSATAHALTSISLIAGTTVNSTDLAQLGLDLVLFGENFAMFINSISGMTATNDSGFMMIDDASSFINSATDLELMTSSIEKVLAIATLVHDFSKTIDSDVTTSLIGGGAGFGEFSTNMGVFAESLASFSEAVKEIDEDDFKKMGTAILIMIDIATIANMVPEYDTNIFSWFSKTKSLAIFFKDLRKATPEIKKMAEEMGKFTSDDWAALENTDKLASVLTSFDKALTVSDDTKGLFERDISLSEFGAQISSFIVSLNAYVVEAKKIKPEDVDAVQPAIDIVTALSTLSDDLPALTSVYEALFGGKMDFTMFSTQITDLAQGIVDFTTIAGGTDQEALDNAITAASSLLSFAGEVGKTDGLSNVQGNMDGVSHVSKLSTLAEGIGSLGDNLASFTTATSSIDKTSFDEGLALVKSFVDTLVELEDVDVITVNDLANSVGLIINQMTTSAITTFTNKGVEFETAVINFIDIIPTTIVNQNGKVKTAFESTFNTGITAMKHVKDSLLTESILAGLNVSTGLASNKESIKDSAEEITTQIELVFLVLKSKMKTIGEDTIDGFIQGLTDVTKKAEVKKAATEIAETVSNTMKDVLDIQSPSKETEEIGDYTIEGLILSLSRGAKPVMDASMMVGEYSIEGLIKALAAGTKPVEAETTEIIDYSIENMILTLANSVDPIKSEAMKVGEAVLDGVTSGMADLAEALRLENYLDDSLTDTLSQVEQFGNAIFSGLKDGVYVGETEAQFDPFSVINGVFNDTFETQYEKDAAAYMNQLIAQFVDPDKLVHDGREYWFTDPDMTLKALEGAIDLEALAAAIEAERLFRGADEEEEESSSSGTASSGSVSVPDIGTLIDDGASDITDGIKESLGEGIGDIVDKISGTDWLPDWIPDWSGESKVSESATSTLGIDDEYDYWNNSYSYNQAETVKNDTQPTQYTEDSKKSGEVTFIQNNTSPKALSYPDIYRQTSNLLAFSKKR